MVVKSLCSVRSDIQLPLPCYRHRRTWKPNVQKKGFISDHLMPSYFRIRCTTHALRCIDKAGGIDNYLMRTSDQKLGAMGKAQVLKRRMLAFGFARDALRQQGLYAASTDIVDPLSARARAAPQAIKAPPVADASA